MMSTEPCKICHEDSTPYYHINGHICEACYYAAISKVYDRIEWISIKDKYPDENAEVMTYSEGGRIAITIFFHLNLTHEPMFLLIPDSGNVRDDTLIYYLTSVTHWQQLPEPPNDR